MLLVKDIVIEGNETLREVAKDVSVPIKKKDLSILKSMMKYLKNSQNEKKCEKYQLKSGVGLAAPQINQSKRMLAILAPDDNGVDQEFGIINPVILGESVEMTYLDGGEGCLSVPNKAGVVLRHKKMKFKAFFYNYNDGSLEEKTVTFTNYLSIVFQHEFDHLNGVLFIDKITDKVEGIVSTSYPLLKNV